jgi:hypothetical protein
MLVLSEEQQQIIDSIKTGQNVVVDACAGSGKSTTILAIAREFPEERILQLTYNSALRKDVQMKIQEEGIENLVVHTFHSLAVATYLTTAHTDAGIRKILFTDMKPRYTIPVYSKIVLDEAQDMSLDYFRLMQKFIGDMCSESSDHKIQLTVMGDYMQGLYEFKGSDIRFLTMADLIWSANPYLRTPEFVKCTMKMSYRITDPMCDFVNQCMLGENRLLSCKPGAPVTYIRNTRFLIEKTVIILIKQLLERGVEPSDIFVLGASVKGVNSSIRKIENALVSNGVQCYVPMLENDKIDERTIKGKVVFSTFHCVKGRQRKFVFVVGFDNYYFSRYGRTLDRSVCPNTLYVGCTRATEGLYLLESGEYNTDRPLDFLKMTHKQMQESAFVDFRGTPRSIFYEPTMAEKKEAAKQYHYTTPTDMIRFVSETVLEEITPILDRIFIKKSEGEGLIDIPGVIETGCGLFEEVSDLTGIAVQFIFFDHIRRRFSGEYSNLLYEMIQDNLSLMKSGEHGFLRKMFDDIDPFAEFGADYIYLANIYQATQEKLYFKLKQIDRDRYTWLTDSIVEQCLDRLERVVTDIGENPLMEETIIMAQDEESHINMDGFLEEHFGEDHVFRFTARTDFIGDDYIWELKFTSEISIDHMLQVVIYAWLWKMLPGRTISANAFRLYNIKTGELFELVATNEQLDTIIIALLRGKYFACEPKTDAEFLADCGVAVAVL